jgi:hypothetical protein
MALVLLIGGCSFREGKLQDAAITPPLVDSPAPDAEVDGPFDAPSACADDFVTIAGGNPGHGYKVSGIAAPWIDQQNTQCTGAGGYLAIPDDGNELSALIGVAGDVEIWVGVSDRLDEAQFRDVLNAPYSAITVTGNTIADDCVRGTIAATLDVVDCDQSKIAICECEE